MEKPFFADTKITLPMGEKNVIDMAAHTSGPYCRWTVAVEYLADGKRGTTTITAPGGKPFAITGEPTPQSYHSVFLTPLRGCPQPYERVAGSEYASIAQSAGCGP